MVSILDGNIKKKWRRVGKDFYSQAILLCNSGAQTQKSQTFKALLYCWVTTIILEYKYSWSDISILPSVTSIIEELTNSILLWTLKFLFYVLYIAYSYYLIYCKTEVSKIILLDETKKGENDISDYSNVGLLGTTVWPCFHILYFLDYPKLPKQAYHWELSKTQSTLIGQECIGK